MRWLVPKAAAIWRRLTSLSPLAAAKSTAASSNVALVAAPWDCSLMYQMVRCTNWYVERGVTMKTQEIDERAWSPANPDAVYALLADGATWPTWSGIDSFELREPGDDGGEGLNAVRVFRT